MEVPLPPNLRRYWNPFLGPKYDQVTLTPLKSNVPEQRKPLSDGRCYTTILRPSLVPSQVLMGDEFASLLVPNSTDLLPPRPCYAAFPTNKRKAGACSERKEALPPGSYFRALKIRLWPTKAQAKVFRKWFASARYHFNTAADILNTTFDRCVAEEYLDALSRDDPYLTDGTMDPFFWYQFMRAEQISGVSAGIPFKSGPEDAYGDRDILGLREAVRDILSAEIDPEKVAPRCKDMKDLRWTQEIPTHIADEAVKDALKALTTNLAKFANGNSHRFRGINFRSLKNLTHTPTEVLRLDATRSRPGDRVSGPISKITATHNDGRPPRTGTSPRSRRDFYIHLAVQGCMKGLGPVRAVDHKPVVDWITGVGYTEHQSEILWDKRVDHFYIILKRVVKRGEDERSVSQKPVVSKDPGVRCFQAFSCPDGRHGSLLEGALEVMQTYAKKASHLQSIADKLKDGGDFRQLSTRSSIRRDVKDLFRDAPPEVVQARKVERVLAKARRMRAKARNWMKAMHYEAIRELFSLGDIMILPVFETQRMCARAERIFGTGTAKDMYAWSHYKFAQRLYHKAQITPDKHVIFSREPGTTKTCDACGYVRENLGGAKKFRCYNCNHCAGRDVGHASRGNLLAAIGAANNMPWDGIERVATRGGVVNV